MSGELVAAIITGAFSVLAVWLTSRKAGADMDAKLDKQQAVFEAHVTEQINSVKADVRRLEVKQDKHNEVIERTYALEKNDALQDAEIKRLGKRLELVEGEHEN